MDLMYLVVPFSLLWMPQLVFERISCVFPWVFKRKSWTGIEFVDIPTGTQHVTKTRCVLWLITNSPSRPVDRNTPE